jgi:drug/metabolite transporter (DMT)-like permease
MEAKGSVGVYLKLLGSALFWGGTYTAGRIVVRHVEPFSASFLRFVIAAVLLVLITWRTEGRLPPLRRHQILPVVVLGLTGVFAYNAFFLNGIRIVEAGRASMIVANNPIFIALFSAWFFREHLTRLKVVGILVSILGAMVVISRGHLSGLWQGGIGKGELLILGCVASWATYSLVGKVLMKDLKPLPSVMYSVLVGTAALAVPALFEGMLSKAPAYTLGDWLCLAYLGIFGTVFGFVWFYEGIQKIGPTRAGLFINFVPLCAVIIAHFTLGEVLSTSLLTGAVLVTAGVYLTNRTPAPAATRTDAHAQGSES